MSGTPRFRIRPVRIAEDLPRLAAIDPSFRTDRIYRVAADGLAFALVEERLETPLVKSYPLDGLGEDLDGAGHAVVAEAEGGGEVVGFATAKYEPWNRRATLQNLFAAPPFRGCGAGRALLDSAVEYARTTPARCLWLETQNVNFAAINFYRRAGFRLCGLDVSLYDPRELGAEEVAIFLARDLGG